MEVYRIDISSWTASFRYPNFMTAFHPTLEVPPISTVLGLINAAAGQYLHHNRLRLGYYFEFEAQGEDVETVYKYGVDKGKMINRVTAEPIKREFLAGAFLRLYLQDEQLANYFRQPYYPLLLGRSGDLATVENITQVNLPELGYATNIKGQVIPLKGYFLPGQIQPLPCYFTESFPRQNIGTQPYSVISAKDRPVEAKITTFRDEIRPGEHVDIFFHELDFSTYR